MLVRPLETRPRVRLLSALRRFRAGPVLLLAAGCSTYHEKPLDSAAIDAALHPALAEVKVAAANLQHPLIPALTIDGRDGFTPDEIAVLSVIASPQLKALRAQRGVARAQLVQAGLLPNPQLGYTLDKPTNDPGSTNGSSLGLSWDVTALLNYRDNVSAARATAGALDLSIAWQEWQAAQEARLRAFRVLSLQARVGLARETENELADALKLAREAVQRGHLALGGLTVASEAWSAAQDTRFALEQELAAERLALNLALGQPADAAIALRPAANFPELPADTANASALLDGLEKRRLDLVALTLGYQSSEASLRAAVKAQFPKINLIFGRARDTSDVKTNSFGVTIDLPLFDRNQGQIAIAKATREQLFEEYAARVSEARAEVLTILSNLAVTRTQLKTIEAELPELEQLAAALDKAMQTRNTDVQTWREARGALLARRVELSKMQQDVLELGVALEIATGRPLLNHSVAN
jgi:outer membrane protein TolC